MKERRRSRRTASPWVDSSWPEGALVPPSNRRLAQGANAAGSRSEFENGFLRRYTERIESLGSSVEAVREAVQRQLMNRSWERR